MSGNGWGVPRSGAGDPDHPGDHEELGRSLQRLLDDQALVERLGTAARRRVGQHFLGTRHLTQYVELFATLVRPAS